MTGQTWRITTAALAVLLGVGVTATAQDPDRAFPQSVDPNSVQSVQVKDLSNRVVLSGTFDAGRPDGNETLRSARLAGATSGTASGIAEIEVSTRNGSSHRELDVDVDDLAPRAEYKLYVDEIEIATFTTDGGGDASIDFDDTPGR
jgi:hypothetical protein